MKLLNTLKTNRTASIFILATVASLLLVSALSACNLQDMVRVKVPEGVQQAIHTDAKIPLSDANATWDEWTAWVERQSGRFSKEIEKGQETASIITALTNTGISLGQEASSTLPGGAILGSGLALLGGLFIRKPGDAKVVKEAKKKEELFSSGLKSVLEIAGAAKAKKTDEDTSDNAEA